MISSSHLSMRQKLIWLILLASALALLCVTAAVVFFEATTFRPRMVDRLQAEASILEEVLSAPLDFRLKEAAEKALRKHCLDRAMVLAVLYDTHAPFAAYRRLGAAGHQPPPAPEAAGHAFAARQLSLWWPVRDNGGTLIGHLYLLEELPPLYARLPQYGIMTGAVILALAVVGVVLMRGVRRNVLHPLEALLQTTNQVTWNSDYSVRAVVRREDELGQLARAFNQMFEAVGHRDAALREASTRIENVFNSATEVLIVATDPQGQVTVFSTGAERMLGYGASEIVGKVTPVYWHKAEEVAARAAELSRQLGRTIAGFETFVALARSGNPEALEWSFIRKNGTPFTGYLVVTVMLDAKGGVAGFLGVASDVTERKRAEEALRESEERFRSLIENASDVITVLNVEGIFRYQSPSSERVLGYSPAELTGRQVSDFIHPVDLSRVTEALQRAMALPIIPSPVEYRFRHRNGSWRILESIGRSIQGAAPDGYIIVNSRDITESMKLEEQLRQSQKMEAIGQLSGGVAHDFNNLLTVIQGHVSLLETEPNLAAELRESVTEIKQSTERAANLTRQLLAFSRRQTMQRTDLDLNEVVVHMTRMLQRILGEDIQLRLHCAPQPVCAHADAGMMEQILLNLAVNSRDAMPKGGQLVIEIGSVELDEATARQLPQGRAGGFVCLTVRDTGCGIPPEIMPHIFEPFFTTKDVGKGTGLGLATVYGIVQQHKGWINVSSEVGQGATFRLYLPRRLQAIEPAPNPSTTATVRGGDETILLVEDELALRNLARKVLTRLGYRVLEAPTGVSALEVWREHHREIRLLLTDLVMPDGLSGRELARQLHLDNSDLKVIYTSGYSADIAGQEFTLEEGVNFLAKPFTPQKLAHIVRAKLDR